MRLLLVYLVLQLSSAELLTGRDLQSLSRRVPPRTETSIELQGPSRRPESPASTSSQPGEGLRISPAPESPRPQTSIPLVRSSSAPPQRPFHISPSRNVSPTSSSNARRNSFDDSIRHSTSQDRSTRQPGGQNPPRNTPAVRGTQNVARPATRSRAQGSMLSRLDYISRFHDGRVNTGKLIAKGSAVLGVGAATMIASVTDWKNPNRAVVGGVALSCVGALTAAGVCVGVANLRADQQHSAGALQVRTVH